MPRFDLKFMAFHSVPGARGNLLLKQQQTIECASLEEADRLVKNTVGNPILMTGTAVPEGAGQEEQIAVHRTFLFPVSAELIEYGDQDPYVVKLRKEAK